MLKLKSITKKLKLNNPFVWLVFSIVIYIILQIFTLGTRSLDGDEGVILNVVQAGGWSQFWQRIASDVHPPLYHILAKVSTSVFGVHEWSLRLPAAAAGGLLIFLGYWLGLKLWSDKQKKWKALALGICFGFVPYLFYYHGEARFYSWLLVGAVLTYGALLEMLKGKKLNIKNWLIFFLGALILVWSQHLGWFVLGAEFIALLVLKQWNIAKWGIIILALLLVSFVPYLRILVEQFGGRISEQGGWVIGQNIIGLLNALYRFGADRIVLGIGYKELMSGGWLKILLFCVTLFIPLMVLIVGVIEKKTSKIL